MAFRINEKSILQVKECLDLGYNIHQMVELLDASYSSIDRIVRKIRGTRKRAFAERGYQPPFNHEEIRKVNDLLIEGYQSTEIGRILNRPQSSVHRMICLIKFSRVENLTKYESLKIKRYLRLASSGSIIKKLYDVKEALGEEHIPLREDLINDLFIQPAQKKSIVSSTPAPLTTELEDLKNEFNNQIKCIQMQIEILTETIMEIKNGKNN